MKLYDLHRIKTKILLILILKFKNNLKFIFCSNTQIIKKKTLKKASYTLVRLQKIIHHLIFCIDLFPKIIKRANA